MVGVTEFFLFYVFVLFLCNIENSRSLTVSDLNIPYLRFSHLNDDESRSSAQCILSLDMSELIILIIAVIIVVICLYCLLVLLSSTVHYIPFNINLCMCKKYNCNYAMPYLKNALYMFINFVLFLALNDPNTQNYN